jgi:hypothetical protein
VVGFFLRLFSSASNFHYEEKERGDALQEKLSPKIHIYLDRSCNGVAGFPVSGEVTKKWVQFIVSCATDSPFVDCEAWLKRVEKLDHENAGEQLVEEPVNCGWSQVQEEKIKGWINGPLYFRFSVASD